jgi:hypothetical protein
MDGFGRLSPPDVKSVKPLRLVFPKAAVQANEIYLFPANDL